MILLENGEFESEDEEEDKEDIGPIYDEEEEPFDYPHNGPLLVARKPFDDAPGPIFDEKDNLLDGELVPVFEDTLGPIFDEEDTTLTTHLMVHFSSLGEH